MINFISEPVLSQSARPRSVFIEQGQDDPSAKAKRDLVAKVLHKLGEEKSLAGREAVVFVYARKAELADILSGKSSVDKILVVLANVDMGTGRRQTQTYFYHLPSGVLDRKGDSEMAAAALEQRDRDKGAPVASGGKKGSAIDKAADAAFRIFGQATGEPDAAVKDRPKIEVELLDTGSYPFKP